MPADCGMGQDLQLLSSSAALSVGLTPNLRMVVTLRTTHSDFLVEGLQPKAQALWSRYHSGVCERASAVTLASWMAIFCCALVAGGGGLI